MTESKKSYYKYCIVPLCTNTTSNSSEKLFFSVPKDPRIRKSWTIAMKRDDKLNPKLSNKSSHWCCEDHFSLKDDMENYYQWMMTKNVKRLKLKPGTVPHRFDCQKKDIKSPIERKGVKKRKHLSLIEEALSSSVSIPSINKIDKSLPVNIKKTFKSTGMMTTPQMVSIACSPIKSFESLQDLNLSKQLLGESSAEIEDSLKIDIAESSKSDYECSDESSSEDELFDAEQYKQHMLTGTIMSVEKKPKIFLETSIITDASRKAVGESTLKFGMFPDAETLIIKEEFSESLEDALVEDSLDETEKTGDNGLDDKKVYYENTSQLPFCIKKEIL